MTKDELFNSLIIFAINTHAQNGYRNGQNGDILTTFCKLPLGDLASFWKDCSDQTKLIIVKSHEEEFLSWVKASGNSND